MTRHVLAVEEILQFPDNYHTKGILSLPYGDIVEPFEAWYSKPKKMSRIDYYNGEKKVEEIAGFIVECAVKCSFVLRRFAKALVAQTLSPSQSSPGSLWEAKEL